MTRTEAIAEAARRHRARGQALLACMYGRTGPLPNDADYGHRHGWYSVGEFDISTDEFVDRSLCWTLD